MNDLVADSLQALDTLAFRCRFGVIDIAVIVEEGAVNLVSNFKRQLLTGMFG